MYIASYRVDCLVKTRDCSYIKIATNKKRILRLLLVKSGVGPSKHDKQALIVSKKYNEPQDKHVTSWKIGIDLYEEEFASNTHDYYIAFV